MLGQFTAIFEKGDKYYIGYTSNLYFRVFEHNRYKGHKSKFTKKMPGIWKLEYYEIFASRKEALIKEKQIKSMKSKQYIQSLIEKARL